MNNSLSQFIASRLSVKNAESYSAFITRVAAIAVGISLAVMLLAISISQGYDHQIRKKIFGFWGHIQIEDAGSKLGLEAKPIHKDSIFTTTIDGDWIKDINFYALKPGLIKQDGELYGILVKGNSKDFNWQRFEDFIIEGRTPENRKEVLVSKILAKKLQLSIGDKVPLHFIQNPMRARAPKVSGIYSTNMVELDEQIIFSTIDMVQGLNGWSQDQVQGAELFIAQPEQSQAYAEYLQKGLVDYDKVVTSIERSNPEIFDWLGFLKTNQWLVLVLMGIVAIVNMMSMLLVLILERSKMIGVLKALGAPYTLLRNIFLRKALQIILFGLLLGNLFGLGLAFLQAKFKFIRLDPEAYFLNHVPVKIDLLSILLLNLATIAIILFSLLLPSLLIRRINPIQALQFE